MASSDIAKELRQMADRVWEISEMFPQYLGPKANLEEASGELHTAARLLENAEQV